MIPMPLLIWFATMVGQPVVVVVTPGAVPHYQLMSDVCKDKV